MYEENREIVTSIFFLFQNDFLLTKDKACRLSNIQFLICKFFNSLPNNPDFSRLLTRLFENNVGKEENAANQHFFPIHEMFSTTFVIW